MLKKWNTDLSPRCNRFRDLSETSKWFTEINKIYTKLISKLGAFWLRFAFAAVKSNCSIKTLEISNT